MKICFNDLSKLFELNNKFFAMYNEACDGVIEVAEMLRTAAKTGDYSPLETLDKTQVALDFAVIANGFLKFDDNDNDLLQITIQAPVLRTFLEETKNKHE